MRQFACLAAGAMLVCSLPAFAACTKESARSHYSIRGEYFPEENVFAATMSADILNKTQTAFDMLPFELYPNAYREGAAHAPFPSVYEAAVYYGGKEYGGIEIGSVEGAAGYSVGGEDENILRVSLAEPLYPDERVTLTISFRVQLPKINHRLGKGEHTVNLANFYPVLCAYDNGFLEYVYSEQGDPFVSDCADYDVEICVPASYTVVGASLASEGEKRTYALHAKNVRDVAFVIGENFSSLTREAGGVPVTYYYFDDADPETALTAAAESLSCFSELFTPYAYPSYTVVQTDLPYGGMEYPMLSMIGAQLQSGEIPFVVAHETAHQWWYAMVGSNQYSEAWQDEALAEWSVALFAERHPAYGSDYRACVNASEKSYRAFYSVFSQLSPETDTRMSRPLSSYSGIYEYRNLAYDKGVILFDRLRDVMGEKKLISGLKNYAVTFEGAIASPADLVSCLSRAGGNIEDLVFSFTDGKCVI